MTFEDWSFVPTPETEFTLAHHGADYLERTASPKGGRGYLYLGMAGLAVLLLIAGVAMKRLAGRTPERGAGKSVSEGRSRLGFTLVETLVAIGVVGALVALLLPAALQAREAARRTHCLNNLRQIGVGLNSYHNTHGVFPLGRLYVYDTRYVPAHTPCANINLGPGFLVSILPYMEQSALHQRFNFDLGTWAPENLTVLPARVGVHVCPNDTASHAPRIAYPLASFPMRENPYNFPVRIARTSYAGVEGTNYGRMLLEPGPNGCQLPVDSPIPNGCINDFSPVGIASIRDGTSQTMIVGETETTTRASLSERWFEQTGWWHMGELAHTMLTAAFPPNARKSAGEIKWVHAASASSLHPGGVNILLVDGSSRFVKETIQSWQLGSPINHTKPDRPPGVWQALATYNGGEVISGDSF